MIKEKHEKGADGGVKEEPGGSEKDAAGGGGGGGNDNIKKEDDTTTTCSVGNKKGQTKNGTIIGSTNMGSLHDVKTEHDDGDSTPVVKDELDSDLPSDAFNMNMVHTSGTGGGEVQSLPSNVITKQPSSMEVQYMQQQSQIFVFSTVLANTGADEVLQGRFPSIIAFHCSQPGTKKYLEKNPLKMAQFHRQAHGQWPGAMNKSNKSVRSPVAPTVNVKQPPSAPAPGGPPSDSLDFLSGDPLDDIGDLPWENKDGENGLSDDMDPCNVQPSLQGVKVPDENLTPQQRQHREEQLATIRKLHQMLCSDGPGGPGGDGMPGVPPNNQQQPPTSQSGAMPGQAPDMDLPGPGPPMDWQKMQYKPGMGQGPGPGNGPGLGPGMGPRTGPGSGPRLQGPPPPYHQTPRSASVPIALQSPNPASPNNPTSNLSLPSPSRASSALNSPADSARPFGLQRHVSATGQSPTSQDSPSRPNHSNPGTPISSHLSPSVNTSSADTNPTSDGLFGRTLQSMAAQQKQMAVPTSGGPNMQPKEPNLMPVPSPQQIQYLNAFEGQELIIQKQPNTSLNKEGNMISPPVLPTTMDSGFPGNNDLGHNRLSGPNTPTSMDMGPRFPGTPSDGCRFSVPSPHTPSGNDKSNRLSGSGPGLSPQTGPPLGSDQIKNEMFPVPSPHMMDVPRFPGPSPSPGNKMPGPGNFVNVSPSGQGPGKPHPMEMGGNYGNQRNDNVPLNPNCTNAMSNPKVSHFDPISSLAQMSQQLTNSASSLNGQGGPGGPGGMMNFGSPSMHMMDMGACHGMPDMDPMGMGQMQGPPHGPPHGFHPGSPMGGPIRSLSPKLPGGFGNHVGMSMPRMMGRPPGPNPYNGANVQVKPNAPNTIQYMPAKPQGQGPPPGPRGPPSLEFLQRYANPMGGPGHPGGPNMDGKMGVPGQGMQYFGGCGPNGPMGHMDGPGGPMQDGPMGPGPMGGMGNGGPMMGGPPNMGMMPMMRPMRPPGPQGMMRMPMGFNGPPNGPGGPGGPGGPPDGMFQPGPPPNAQMFVGGPKGSPMGVGMGGGMGGPPPDAGQPLPPSMSQNNSFKSSPFVGPTTADPNYAQQFHNFQQQLYATGSRNPMGGQPMGPGPPPGHPQQAYFNPK